MWGWGLCPVIDDWQSLTLDHVDVGRSLADFLDEVTQLGNTVVYFHNLKFDGRFILDHLLHIGYTHNSENGSLIGTFQSLISDTGQFYTLTVSWENGCTTEFRDSLKKLPMSVVEVSKAFPLPDEQQALTKGDIDYDLPRPVGWIPTAAEREYIQRDVLIVARALGQQFRLGLQKLTVGSDALWEYKQLMGKKQYESLFPCLSISMDAEIRRALRGGFTYADPRFTGRVLGSIDTAAVMGRVFDVNSLYPSVMFHQAMPYGVPEWVDGIVEPTKTQPLTISSITFTARLKPGHIPCIQVKGNSRFMPTEYLSEITEPTNLVVTNIDYQLMLDHYDVTVLEYAGGWRFRAAHGLFDAYITKWLRVKEHSTGGMRSLSKLQLNSLYGKFATNPRVTSKEPYLDTLPDGSEIVRLRVGSTELRDPVYTPAGVFITSYARNYTIRAAQDHYDSFAYADTDSLHLITDTMPTGLDIHPTRLGAWKHELDFTGAYYIRAKAYLEHGRAPHEPETANRFHNAIAGVPTYMSAALTFADLVPGTAVTVRKRNTTEHEVTRTTGNPHDSVMMHGKLVPRAYPGGIVLEDTPFELVLNPQA